MELFAKREIPRPSHEVSEFFFDAANNPTWQKGMRRCEWIEPGPIEVGSVYLQEARFLGRTITSRFVVTEYTPRSSIAIQTIESTFPIEVTRTVEPVDDASSRVTARISGDPGGVFTLLAPVIRRLAQRSVDADYDRLVAHFSA